LWHIISLLLVEEVAPEALPWTADLQQVAADLQAMMH
jgi:hypothetical protein